MVIILSHKYGLLLILIYGVPYWVDMSETEHTHTHTHTEGKRAREIER